ncbi:MAG: bifunctional uridylyltransferase/uridylyl-removing protein, partial [Terriglobales bacterium]
MGKPLSLRALYSRESARIRKEFDQTTDGFTAASQRSALVDKVALRLWQETIAGDAVVERGICLAARGGYGRGLLLPHSDLDLLFLSDDPGLLNRAKDAIGRMCQQMWDLGLRVAPTARTLAGCAEFDSNNLELTLSLLECRHLAGDDQLFRQLYDETIPKVVRRSWDELVETLVELTRRRHAKYANTVFHLEPNVKECPGGLRDANIAGWLATLVSVKKGGSLRPDAAVRNDRQAAVAFLISTRCFLHYLYERDDNVLRWEAQDAAAVKGIGVGGHPFDSTAEWTRHFFRHARPINRWTNQLLDEVAAERSSLYRQFLSWRSRVSNRDFAVTGGRVYLQESSGAADPDLLLRLFEFLAHHGFKLAADTQSRIEKALPALSFPTGSELWSHLRGILTSQHAADALRDMHAVGILDAIIPEFRLIDSLIIRDFYHRYTV